MGRVVYLSGTVPGDAQEVRRNTAYAAAAYLYAAIRYRAENVAEPPLRVIERTEDGDEILEDHPIYALLDDPSPDYDMGEIVELTQTYWDLDGDALWVKDDNLTGATGLLTPFSGSEYDVRSKEDRIVGEFDFKRLKAGSRLKGPEDVVYFRYPNPYDRRRGTSPTDVALSWLNLGQRTTATIRSLLQNAVFPSVIVQPHQEWHPSEEEFERFKDQIDQFHAGPENAGKPFVALGGGRVSRVAFTLQDLLPEELLNRVEATVAAVFRIPPVVLGFLVGLENSPWSQMEQAHKQAYHDSIQPLWRRIEKATTRQLLRPLDADPRRRLAFDTSQVEALQEDRSRLLEDAARATHWTVDERRVYTGQEPFGDERGEWVEMIDGQPVFEPGVPVGGKIHVPALATKVAEDRSWKWARFDLMAKAQESTWQSAVGKQLRADRRQVLKLFDDIVGSSKDKAPAIETKDPPIADPKKVAALIAALTKKFDIEGAWESRMGPLIESTGLTALKELASDLGVSFDVLEPTLLEYVRTEGAHLVTKVTDTTRHGIAAQLKAGLAEGESITTMRKRLEDAWEFSSTRAELIARTQTTRVTVGAQRTAMSDYQADNDDQVVEKSWLSSRDPRVRLEHEALDKDGAEKGWIGIDDAFENGLQGPSEPNCRCALLFRVEDE